MSRLSRDAAAQLREEGWALVPGVLDSSEVAQARAEAAKLVPSVAEYDELTKDLSESPPTDDPTLRYHRSHVGGRLAPWQRQPITVSSPVLFQLGVAPWVLEFAHEVLGEAPMLDSANLSAKYSRGGTDFEQGFHFDPLYAVYPRRSTPSFRMWVYLTDVTADCGPTEVMPHAAIGDDDLRLFAEPTPDFAGFYSIDEHPELSGHAVTATGEAGSALFYQGRTHHRGTEFRRGSACRWIAAYAYRSTTRTWMGVSWDLPRDGRAIRPDFASFGVEQRTSLGFPPLGDPYWQDEGALDEVERIFRGIDVTPYAPT